MAKVFIESLFYPSELAALIQYKLRPVPTNKIPPENKSKIKCYDFLNKTSRSFSAVIQGLDDELRDAVMDVYNFS